MDTILVLDDDEVFTQLLETILKLEGYRPVVLAEPAELVNIVRQLNPALALLDVRFRDQKTFDVVQDLRADSTLPTMPVLMTSGIDYRQESLAAGADAFLLKPFAPKELLSAIKSLIYRQDIEYNGKKKED